MQEILAGALLSPRDPDDCIYEHIACGQVTTNSILPEEFDLRSYMRPARDQGVRPTCAAFCASAMREIQEKKHGVLDEYMSPEFIYFHRENKPGAGMYGRNVFQILQKIGTVPESMF